MVTLIIITAEYELLLSKEKTILLQPEAFEEVNRTIAKGILKNPNILYSINPRFFEELIANYFFIFGI